MIQIPLLGDDPVHRLKLFGYTEREADFLCLVGLQSGFFLRRQYTQFAGTRAGGADVALITKLLAKGHASAVMGCHQTQVYHLCARSFYAALAPGDNRNRRMRPPASIKCRLMALDYILDHSGPRYLGNEQEKIAYFTRALGFELSVLPVKEFRSPKANDTAARFFVDKYPISVREEPSEPSQVSFCFVDEGFATCAHFEAYLRQYRSLFDRLDNFQLIYVASSQNLFWEAERLFLAFALGDRSGHASHLDAVDFAQLREHFEDRKRAETGNWQGLSRDKLIHLREDREKFSGRFFESLYGQWKLGGQEAMQTDLARKSSLRSWNGAFSTYLLKHRYDLFGSPSEGRDA
jgi:hypothetical protein